MKPANGLPDWAAVVLVLGPEGKTVLVFDPEKNNPMWKLSGGKNEGLETPEETAARELYEETGLKVNPTDLLLVKEVDKSRHKNPHTLFIFMVCVSNFDGLVKIGNEGEYVGVYDLVDVPKMKDFFPAHWEYIKGIFEEALR